VVRGDGKPLQGCENRRAVEVETGAYTTWVSKSKP